MKLQPAMTYCPGLSIEMHILRLRRRVTMIERSSSHRAWWKKTKKRYGIRDRREPYSRRGLVGRMIGQYAMRRAARRFRVRVELPTWRSPLDGAATAPASDLPWAS